MVKIYSENLNMERYTLAEWQNEGIRRFGNDPAEWKFKCPACGRINKGQEFKDLGAEPGSMYTECLGRMYLKDNEGLKDTNKDNGCDWASYGLMGTLGKGVYVEVLDEETNEMKLIEVFDFADI